MKGIIIAAGYGTRFLPGTKTVPKEMFPLIDTPAIDLIVDEFAAAGIRDILIVSSRRKKTLEDYFDREIELESVFTKEGNSSKLAQIKPRDVRIFYTRQQEMRGTGDAILLTRTFVGDEPCIIAYPDDLVFAKVPLSKQLIDIHTKTGGSVLAVQAVEGDVSRYGVVGYTKEADQLRVSKIVEKPAPGSEPSKMISVGRYLFTPDLFPLLEEDFRHHQKGEFYHINAINTLAAQGKMFACQFEGERVDVGDKLGYFEGIIKYALTRADLCSGAEEIIQKYAKKIDSL